MSDSVDGKAFVLTVLNILCILSYMVEEFSCLGACNEVSCYRSCLAFRNDALLLSSGCTCKTSKYIRLETALHVLWLLVSHLGPEGGVTEFFRNVGQYLPDYTGYTSHSIVLFVLLTVGTLRPPTELI
jgi:hypothetical protein